MKFLNRVPKIFQKRALKIDKRLRLVISVLALGSIVFISTFFYFDKAYFFLPLLFIATYFFTYFSLAEGIDKMGRFGLFLMPEMTTIFFYLFYFLFPGRWLTRLPFIIFYEISIYAVLLCSNIFNVGVEKSLGLYRAAFSINFLYQTIISFIVFNLFFATKTNFLINGVGAGVIGFLMALNLFWTIRLKKTLEKEVLHYALLIAVILFELAVLVSFVPLKTPIYSLFMTASYYSLAGLIYSFIDQRLFKETVREFVLVLSFVLAITIFSISW